MKYIIYILIILFLLCSCSIAEDDVFKRIQEREDSYTFTPFKDNMEGAFSRIQTLITMINNFKYIDNVQKGHLKHNKLEMIIDTFDEIIKNKGRSKETFIILYEYLIDMIPKGRLTMNSNNIFQVLDEGGDCNDMSPLFYSLFEYYGFNMKVIQGRSIKENEKVELHAWIGVEFHNKLIELDPLWYGLYVELKRISNDPTWEICDIKDKYKRFR